jgi:hypothetical protein
MLDCSVMKTLSLRVLLRRVSILTFAFISCSCVFVHGQDLDKVYKDESHGLTQPDMRGDLDAPISCYCRDAIVEARYIYFTYLITFKDRNLNGPFLALATKIDETCGANTNGIDLGMQQDWAWEGPEVVRTYPSDEVIKRIKLEPMRKGAKTLGRWVPYTIQLVYRDRAGRVTKTETYSSREFIPDFDAK